MGAVGKDGRDADGHVYGFLRGKGREDTDPVLASELTPEEDGGGPMPVPEPDPED